MATEEHVNSGWSESSNYVIGQFNSINGTVSIELGFRPSVVITYRSSNAQGTSVYSVDKETGEVTFKKPGLGGKIGNIDLTDTGFEYTSNGTETSPFSYLAAP